jgi:hypothetical protein
MSGIFDQIINYSPPLIVSGTVNYKGTWNASTNNPTLNSSPAASTKGDYYVVSTAGTQFGITFAIGDWIISNGTAWEKVDLTDAVSSVFGRTGAVVGVSTDYSAVGLTNTAIGASSPSTGAFTTVSASTPIAVASGGTGVSTSTGTTNVVLSNSPTIVTPVIAQINDASGNETLKLASIASAVNEISIENAATGNPVHIRATGGDASVGLHLVAKGASGYVNVTDGVDETKRLMFNASGGTTNTRTMLSSTQTVDRTLTLPDATGTLLYGGGPLGTPSSGTVTNLTGTASININGTVGATTASTGAFTTLSASGAITSTATGDILSSIAATTTEKFSRLNNTSGATKWGTESSVGGTIFTGTTSYASVFGSALNNPVQIASNNSVVGTFTSTGLGIGTSSPAQKLDVYGTGMKVNNASYVGYLGDGNTFAGGAVSDFCVRSDNVLSFAAGGPYERARIDSSGNLLVGLTATSAYMDGALDVQASGENPAICAKLNPSSSTKTQFVYSAWAPFTTGDNIFMQFETETSATVRGAISYNRAAGLVVYGTTSDYRSKDILGPVVDSGALIDSVPVYMGKMKGATQERPMFIAHETPAYAHTGEKDAVDAEGKPIYQQIDTSALLPVLWAEIQSLRQRVAALETK